MNIDPSTTKYLIKAKIVADGVVEQPDVVGAIFGQTEGLLGAELDLRDMQKSGRIGRIDVDIGQNKGKSEGDIMIPSSLDQVETVILASALETIDRVGPCKATIKVTKVEDVRLEKRNKIRQSVQVEEIKYYGKDKCPAGPNVASSDAVIVVEGRNDVLNLLKYGIKNAIAVEGTNVPPTIRDLSKERIMIAFVDGDRGGELILRELLQVAEVDFVARAPQTREVEDLTQKQIMKALRNKIPAEQYVDMYGLAVNNSGGEKGVKSGAEMSGKKPSGQGARAQKSEIAKKHEKEGGTKSSQENNKSKTFDPKLKKYKEILRDLSGSSKAQLLNSKDMVVKETAVRDLADALKKSSNSITTIIFDGVITQRLLDIASEKGVNTIVGGKVGNVSKQLSSTMIFTKKDLM
jgi:DNA primase